MLRQRVVTALVLLAVLLPTIFWWPAWTWAALTLAFLSVGAREWAGLLAIVAARAAGSEPAAGGAGPARRVGRVAWPTALGVLAIGVVLLAWRWLAGWPAWLALSVSAAAAAWWCLAGPARLRAHRAEGGGAALAAGLLLACWIALIELHAMGPAVLLVAMAIVWIADIAAYFVGRAIGRRKLAPRISPGKSWEGAAGGALAVVAAAWAVSALADGGPLAASLPARLFDTLGPALAVPLFVGLAALSVVGDLHESLLKREAGVKDSGTLLPGHGGVLDRIDALIPVMPAALLLHRLAG
ncbi:phosphatidate cytidylyltransferase [Burkholderiaceae bacterium FT117]|uniref:phosphatidate cytidylyltransferase n=1 Tax=Zeimonas sediminis TaxID=2944268 RepID=UPI002342F3B8|nr:phosphatidate cytidylyltransferase [Zeimonas sediminis]MCM5569189.1 phosphatidate cytidylyltransferase [Zeimonas sediminis]